MRCWSLVLLFFSLSANACWKVEGNLGINGDSVEIAQKFTHDKTYSFQAKNYLFHVKIPKGSKDTHLIEIKVQQKDGVRLLEVAQEKMLVKSGNEATMTKEDAETKTISSFTFKITDI